MMNNEPRTFLCLLWGIPWWDLFWEAGSSPSAFPSVAEHRDWLRKKALRGEGASALQEDYSSLCQDLSPLPRDVDLELPVPV